MTHRYRRLLHRWRPAAALVLIALTACPSSDGGGGIIVQQTATVTSVSVSPGTGAILVGATTTFVASVAVTGTAANTVTWTSSNSAVASVNASGNTVTITGTGAGTVTITATSTFDATKSGSATVTVTAPQTIGLNPSSRTFTAVQNGTLPANQTVAITASSGVINGLLGNITVNNGSGWLTATFTGGTTTPTVMTVQILTTSLTPGTYTGSIVIGAPGVAGSATISVTYTVTAAPGGSTGCTLNASTTAVSLGQRVTGALASTDCILAGSFVDNYRLVLVLPTVLQLDQTSDAIDPLVTLLDANGTVLTSDDDGGIGTDAQLTRSLAAGTYFIRASSFDAAEVGAYTLLIGTSNGSGAMCATANGATLTIGITTAGTLAATDCFGYDDGSLGDIYRFIRATTNTVTITMTSTTFDAYLRLLDSFGDLIVEDDNTGGGTNARIARSLAPGTYFLIGTSFLSGATGTYSITTTATAAGALQAVRADELPPKVRAALRRGASATTMREYLKRKR